MPFSKVNPSLDHFHSFIWVCCSRNSLCMSLFSVCLSVSCLYHWFLLYGIFSVSIQTCYCYSILEMKLLLTTDSPSLLIFQKKFLETISYSAVYFILFSGAHSTQHWSQCSNNFISEVHIDKLRNQFLDPVFIVCISNIYECNNSLFAFWFSSGLLYCIHLIAFS